MVALVTEALVFRSALRAAFVVNRRVSRTVIGREARTTLAEHRISPLVSEIHQRIVLAESVAAGRLAFEFDSGRSFAAAEIAALAAEVVEFAR